MKLGLCVVFTDLILPHFLQLVHGELLLLQAVQDQVAEVGELTEGVGEAPQPLVDHLTEGEQAVGHGRPPLPQSDLKQSPDDTSRVLWGGAESLTTSQVVTDDSNIIRSEVLFSFRSQKETCHFSLYVVVNAASTCLHN